MKPTIHGFAQGSDAWHAHRHTHFNASEAAAMMGISAYQTRSELLKEKVVGADDVSPEVQTLFDNGHRFEAMARPWAAEIIGADLFPIVASMEVDGVPLSASYDGTTAQADVIWEHKTLNKELSASLDQWVIPEQYKPQIEQQMLILGAKRCLFMTSNGERESMRYAWYESNSVLRARILAGWKQFAADLAAYQHVEVIPVAVAAPTLALPAVSIKVEGAVALISNLDVFGAGLKAFIARLPEKPSTDQEFADCKAACKTLQEAQDALDAAEAHAMGQVASFDEMKRTKALYWDLARTTRLAVEKLVTAREQQIKVEIVQKAKAIYEDHVASLTKETGGPWIVIPSPDFAGAVKGKRTIASIQDAVDTALAGGKIAADASAKRIREALACIKANGEGYEFLFSDRLALISKPIDDLQLLIKSRIAEHKAKEEKREAEQRERIRHEEAAKLEAEAKRQADANSMITRNPAPDAAAPAPSNFKTFTVGNTDQVFAKPAVTLVKGFVRPTDQTIIDVLANHYRVPEATVISWLKEMAIFHREVA